MHETSVLDVLMYLHQGIHIADIIYVKMINNELQYGLHSWDQNYSYKLCHK
jgi:hypothetical protein